MHESDESWMLIALQQAQRSVDVGEVPVGAVLVDSNGEMVAKGHNRPIINDDPTAHAEIQVIREAALRLENYRLPGTTLYVALEPCAMCVGAIVHARIARVVYGATEPKAGAVESRLKLFEAEHFNHHPEVTSGVLAEDCSAILSEFFEKRRAQKKQ